VVAVTLLVRMGTRWEEPTIAGISNFVHAVMVRGTAKRSGAQLAETIAALGGKLSASGEVDYSELRATALSRFWRELLVITAELALEPKLAPTEVDGERDWLAGRIQKRRDNAPARAFDEIFATMYGAHPYALPVLGTPESLARIDHAAIVAWYRRFYRPERMVLSVSGQVSAPEVLAEVRRLFGGLPGGGAVTEPPRPAPVNPAIRRVVEQPAQQAQILVGGVAPSIGHSDHAAVKVLATVLGGGMAGRLFAELRDRRGLAYTAAAYYDPVREPGALVLYLGSAPENSVKAEEALLQEIERVRNDLVGDQELARAKGYLLGRYAMDRRTNERQAWYAAFYELEGVGQDFPERYRRAVTAVTAGDVQRVARQYLGTRTTVVLRPR
jgi:zinc protease